MGEGRGPSPGASPAGRGVGQDSVDNLPILDHGNLSRVCGPRFVEAETIDAKTLRVRRGYSEFGQPLKETLEAMEILEADPFKSTNEKRLCRCRCAECASRAMHPIHGHPEPAAQPRP